MGVIASLLRLILPCCWYWDMVVGKATGKDKGCVPLSILCILLAATVSLGNADWKGTIVCSDQFCIVSVFPFVVAMW